MNDRECTTACTIPVSFFQNVKCRVPECAETLTWHEFKQLLQHYAQIEYHAKHEAPLLSPTIFKGSRAKENATEAGVVVIDADDGMSFDEALAALQARGLAAVLYTTARNRVGDRFRIVVPLAARVDPETYKRVLIAICRTISGRNWHGDIGKVGPYNLFYAPGLFKSAANRFEVLPGMILSSDAWLELCPIEDSSPEPLQDTPQTKSVDTTWIALTDCPFVRGEWVDEYVSLSSGWYAGLYKFMVRVSMSARAQGWALTATQLADLARELDRIDGGWYPERDLEREAENALAWATGCAGSSNPKLSEIASIWDEQDEMPNEADPSEWQDPAEVTHDNYERADVPSNRKTSGREGLPPLTPISRVTPYAFEDLLFTGRGGAEPRPAFEFLARHCVALGDSFWVRTGDRWAVHSKATARAALIQQYASVGTKPSITVKDIRNFLSDGIVRFHGTGLFPGSPEFVWFQGHKYLNEWADERLSSDIEQVCEAEILLRIIRENLCALDPISLEDMVLECTGDEPTIFKWVMHWFASVYLRPGHHIGTALWFLGPNMGVGKGTIISVLRTLIGSRWVGKASAEEMNRGWTDFLVGKLLMEADEFEIGTRKGLNRLYKQWIGNDLLEISKRHVGSFLIPNVVNHVMTTNEVQPITLEANDRRHTVIHTSNDLTRNALAAGFHQLAPEAKLAAIRGFAAILSAITIDDALISKPFPTAHRTLLMTWSQSAVERWFAARDASWAIEEKRTAQSLFDDFRLWAGQHDRRAQDHVSNVIVFGKEMMKLEPAGYIERAKSSSSVYRKVRYYDPGSDTVVGMHRGDRAAMDEYVRILTAEPDTL